MMADSNSSGMNVNISKMANPLKSRKFGRGRWEGKWEAYYLLSICFIESTSANMLGHISALARTARHKSEEEVVAELAVECTKGGKCKAHSR